MLCATLASKLAALATLFTLTFANPLPKRDGSMFTLTVLDLFNEVPGYNNTQIQARNGRFYIGGGGPTTTCPPSGPCPSNPSTVFECVADNTNTTCYLATQSGKQPIYLDGGALLYAPTYMYGHLTPAMVPFFEHTDNSFAATQFYGTNNAGSFFNENWFGCWNSNTAGEHAPYELYFALSAGTNCQGSSSWIQVVATNVEAATVYAYSQ